MTRTAAPSIDAQLAACGDDASALVREDVAGEARLLVYGRDTLISPRERSELTRTLHKAADLRQPSQLAQIVELMSRCANWTIVPRVLARFSSCQEFTDQARHSCTSGLLLGARTALHTMQPHTHRGHSRHTVPAGPRLRSR